MVSYLDHDQMCLQEGMNLNSCLLRDILSNKFVIFKNRWNQKIIYVTPDHKTSHKGQFLETTIWKTKGAKNLNIEKIAFKAVQIKF